MAPNTTRAETTKRDNTTPSCAVCNRRKVKCDRVYPCAPCKKTGLECAFPAPARKRARRKPPTPPAEGAFDRHSSHEQGAEATPRPANGELAVENASGSIRRVFGGVGYEFLGDGNRTALSNESTLSPVLTRSINNGNHFDMIFGQQTVFERDSPLISPAQVISVWDAYKTHVDPIVKVFHWNTPPSYAGDRSALQDSVVLQLNRNADDCLFRAVSFVTAVATAGAALKSFSEDRGHALINKCRSDAEHALYKANFMNTREMRVLQALVLHLIALQSLGEDETVWMMLAIAIRIASTLGLPQDIGDDALAHGSHSPYQIEVMRRLWWAILALDARVTRILGRTGYLSHNFKDVPRPANADDNALFPSMDSMPLDVGGLTDSTYVRYRATLSDVLPFIYASGNAKDKCTGLIDMIDGAERQIEEEFIQHCDKSIPMHLLTFVAGRGYIIRVKLAVYSIYPLTDDPAIQLPYASEAFWLAKDSMDLFILLWTDPSLKPWHWHWKDFFGWHTLRVLVQEIAKRSSCSKVIEAWKLVKKAASLAVSVLKLGEEKARLVGDLRMLIEAADVRPMTPADSYTYGLGSIVRSIRPGMGTNPHNAMFPGMNKAFMNNEGADQEVPDARTPVKDEFDLQRVNWTEMDRILLQLGTYSDG